MDMPSVYNRQRNNEQYCPHPLWLFIFNGESSPIAVRSEFEFVVSTTQFDNNKYEMPSHARTHRHGNCFVVTGYLRNFEMSARENKLITRQS